MKKLTVYTAARGHCIGSCPHQCMSDGSSTENTKASVTPAMRKAGHSTQDNLRNQRASAGVLASTGCNSSARSIRKTSSCGVVAGTHGGLLRCAGGRVAVILEGQ